MDLDTDEAEKLADALYQKLEPQLKGERGKVIALELDSGDYALGDTVEEAYERAHKKHPSKQFYFKRVGMRAVYFIGAMPS